MTYCISCHYFWPLTTFSKCIYLLITYEVSFSLTISLVQLLQVYPQLRNQYRVCEFTCVKPFQSIKLGIQFHFGLSIITVTYTKLSQTFIQQQPWTLLLPPTVISNVHLESLVWIPNLRKAFSFLTEKSRFFVVSIYIFLFCFSILFILHLYSLFLCPLIIVGRMYDPKRWWKFGFIRRFSDPTWQCTWSYERRNSLSPRGFLSFLQWFNIHEFCQCLWLLL